MTVSRVGKLGWLTASKNEVKVTLNRFQFFHDLNEIPRKILINIFTHYCATLEQTKKKKHQNNAKEKKASRHCDAREFIFGHKVRIQSKWERGERIEMQDAPNTC